MSDYERLKKYAAAAKAGPWSPFITGNVAEVVDNLGKPIINWMGFDDSDIPLHVHKNNARFIAAANPAVVLDLIARVEAAEDKLKKASEKVMEIIAAALSGEQERYLRYDLKGNKYCKWGIVERDILAVFEKGGE